MPIISTTTPADYDAMQRFLEEAYVFPRGYFPRHYNWCCQRHNTDYERSYIIREEGHIVSLVRVFPMELQQGGARVRVGGIGWVATLPASRGKGYMGQLMRHAIRAMRDERYPVSVLNGDQHRYQNYGYQTAGKVVTVTVSRRGLEKSGVAPVAPVIYAGKEDHFAAIYQAYQGRPYRRMRTPEECRAAYEHGQLMLFSAGEGEAFGYVGLFGGPGTTSSVVEFGGRARTILQIAVGLMERLSAASWDFRFPEWGLIPKVFLAAAAQWRIEPSAQIKILDLDGTLSCFRPQMAAAKVPDANFLKNLPEAEQVDRLFGTATDSPFNIFYTPLDM